MNHVPRPDEEECKFIGDNGFDVPKRLHVSWAMKGRMNKEVKFGSSFPHSSSPEPRAVEADELGGDGCGVSPQMVDGFSRSMPP